ncbi:MAG: hypothetical protein ACREN8_07430 [Candidatus Dormibacteraceae bacterium]
MTTASEEKQRGQSRQSLLIAAFGTIIEWYDFSLYLYMAPILTRVFFGGDKRDPALTFSAVAASAIPEQFAAVGRFSGMAIGYRPRGIDHSGTPSSPKPSIRVPSYRFSSACSSFIASGSALTFAAAALNCSQNTRRCTHLTCHNLSLSFGRPKTPGQSVSMVPF